ncbi:PREDICTED: uncharacterized protein At2g39795, mitochondrial [Tarenaya hassleriana]|uniref:uncharacterized protein At2g39795, mitochondrial n=1 Tax=Tarenaya hassleriana TaxID=28532 RepID=UPI00053C5099|nr:PREDICTED: uncharacterized protein At2g39795, mitochondrial [Tarenaya hassleriana]
MGFTWCLRRSASALAPVLGRMARARLNLHGSAVAASVNRSTLARNPSASPFVPRGFLYSTGTENSSSDQTLLRVIDSELKSALETDDHDLAEDTPEEFPFEIEDNPGHQTVTLTREYNGEQIKVVVNTPGPFTGENGEDDMEDDDDETPSQRSSELSIPLVVTVTKKSGLSLEFSCTALPDEIAIDALSVTHPENSSEEPISYDGPDFQDLDENLRKSFHKFLEIRGIKASTTNFLHEYMMRKDSREYLLWLKNLKKFIEE